MTEFSVCSSDLQLRITIAAVSEGLVCADTWLTARRARHRHSLADEEADELPPQPLTAREAEVLAALTTGAGNKQIARTLAISVHTVKFHVAAIIAKLGATGRTDAVARALFARRKRWCDGAIGSCYRHGS